jgi:hypothetical protein
MDIHRHSWTCGGHAADRHARRGGTATKAAFRRELCIGAPKIPQNVSICQHRPVPPASPARRAERAARKDRSPRTLGFSWLSLAFLGFFWREKPRNAKPPAAKANAHLGFSWLSDAPAPERGPAPVTGACHRIAASALWRAGLFEIDNVKQRRDPPERALSSFRNITRTLSSTICRCDGAGALLR